ncbi:hypothetical protein SAMN05444411_101203 [Lutibacter oricola]|uniref:Uncharacterized protein n=1 Tax=Lutibacter oricola TaxID=762486 RepID=A0A1H2RCQ2_9FLAO|nr:DUF6168 family protein [Lutibacter oricola]SDW17085.1 hypothetical protein SAMN05444411_101203 [Lutibacter oricola]
MNKTVLGFSLKLLFTLIITFCVHITILNYFKNPLFENRIILAYSLNYILAIVIFIGLFILQKKYLHILGFVFMGGSMLKFTIFFIFFYPFFKQDGELNLLEATSFLVPYLTSLLIETIYLSKMLNK